MVTRFGYVDLAVISESVHETSAKKKVTTITPFHELSVEYNSTSSVDYSYREDIDGDEYDDDDDYISPASSSSQSSRYSRASIYSKHQKLSNISLSALSGFIIVGQLDTKGRARRLPIKADIIKVLCFPGGTTLMVSHLQKECSDDFIECFKLSSLIKPLHNSLPDSIDQNQHLDSMDVGPCLFRQLGRHQYRIRSKEPSSSDGSLQTSQVDAGRKALDHFVQRATDRRRGVIELSFKGTSDFEQGELDEAGESNGAGSLGLSEVQVVEPKMRSHMNILEVDILGILMKFIEQTREYRETWDIQGRNEQRNE
ncbi:hypothetical protein Tco_0800339 [Tanacetum coccineum]|uniref:Uncharacterized protein n=1 Tax=Tanacetum coccineum TaxID=301880 RepID=A0ABQ4ZV74_9ASTR